MIDYKKIFKNRETRLKLIAKLKFIPDKLYLKIVYRIKTGKKLNLKNPTGFCEKLNYLKIYNKIEKYTDLVDKIKVKEYITKNFGEEYIFPTLGVWDHYRQIDFNNLPDKFVLKCNHDSGSIKVVVDKSEINHKEFENFFENRLKQNPFYIGREYPYKNVKPKIMAEKYMTPKGKVDINDFKFFCFDGEPKIMYIASQRSIDCKFDFYDMNFSHLNIVNIHPQSGVEIEKPEKFEDMVEFARKLSKGFKFVRVDLYQIDGKIYFGEFTFFHGGGFWLMKPEKWEKILGDWINIDRLMN